MLQSAALLKAVSKSARYAERSGVGRPCYLTDTSWPAVGIAVQPPFDSKLSAFKSVERHAVSVTSPKTIIQHAPLNLSWLDKLREDALDPTLAIIDPHHHLWDRWGGYFLGELLADLRSDHNIVATMFAQCGHAYRATGPEALWPVGETEFVVSVAKQADSLNLGMRVCAGIIGHADLTLGSEVDAVLGAHIEVSDGRFRGIRQVTARHPDFEAGVLAPPPLHQMLDAKFREGFARLAGFNLSFDAWVYHSQLEELRDLAAAFPETSIIVNHCGGPLGVGPYAGKRNEVFQDWRARLVELAQLDNVAMKLGGLGMSIMGFDFHKRPLPPSSVELAAAWRPYMETCIELFGADRCMFESNFPVDKPMCSYPVLWNAFKRIAASASKSEKQALFHANAAHIYRLDLAAPVVPAAAK